MKKFAKIALVASVGVLTGMSASAGTLNGTTWNTGKAIVQFSKSGNSVQGKIIKLNDRSKKDAVCSKCTGSKKGKKIEGLVMIWNLKAVGNNKWNGGQLVNPENGKSYKGEVTLNGNTLKLKGINRLGLSKTRTWTKIN